MGAHVHNHSGAAECGHHGEAATRRLAWATVVIVVFFFVEIIGGWLSHSLALLADAGHMATDAMALLLALSARWIARRPAREHMSFGYHRVQVLAAFVNALALLALVMWLIIEAFNRMSHSEPIDAPLMLSVALIGLVANIVAFFLLHGGDKDDVNIRGALLHVIGDLLGSVAAIVAAVVIMATGWLPIDPLLTFLVSALIIVSAVRLLRETAHVLLEGAPKNLQPDRIRTLVMDAVPEVDRIKRLYVWMLTPDQPQLAMHLEVKEGADANKVVSAINIALREHSPKLFTTIQIDNRSLADEPPEDEGENKKQQQENLRVVDPWPAPAVAGPLPTASSDR